MQRKFGPIDHTKKIKFAIRKHTQHTYICTMYTLMKFICIAQVAFISLQTFHIKFTAKYRLQHLNCRAYNMTYNIYGNANAYQKHFIKRACEKICEYQVQIHMLHTIPYHVWDGGISFRFVSLQFAHMYHCFARYFSHFSPLFRPFALIYCWCFVFFCNIFS